MGIADEIEQMLHRLPLQKGFTVCELGDQVRGKVSAKVMYESMGCSFYRSIDTNGKATTMLNLNEPLPGNLDQQPFDLVTDFGTGEHVFDQAQVWRTLHELCAVGGHIAFDRPVQGFHEHGFYNVQVGLYEDIAAANDYDIEVLGRRWIARGELCFGALRKTKDAPFKVPQQGRYRSLERSKK